MIHLHFHSIDVLVKRTERKCYSQALVFLARDCVADATTGLPSSNNIAPIDPG